jgi:hypothetical protein
LECEFRSGGSHASPVRIRWSRMRTHIKHTDEITVWRGRDADNGTSTYRFAVSHFIPRFLSRTAWRIWDHVELSLEFVLYIVNGIVCPLPVIRSPTDTVCISRDQGFAITYFTQLQLSSYQASKPVTRYSKLQQPPAVAFRSCLAAERQTHADKVQPNLESVSALPWIRRCMKQVRARFHIRPDQISAALFLAVD